MQLQQWHNNGWLRSHQTTATQIGDLLAIVDRDLEDSHRDLSPDNFLFLTDDRKRQR